MIRVLMMVHDQNREGATRVACELKIWNDLSGTYEIGNYGYELFEDGEITATGVVTGHDRSQTLYPLVEKVISAIGANPNEGDEVNAIKNAWQWVKDTLGVTKRQQERNRKEALAGRATSGYLSPGERDRFFRDRRKRKS